MKTPSLFFCLCLSLSSLCFANEKTNIRLGVQTGGTLAWELSALNNSNSDYQLEIHALENIQAGKTALQTGAVDMIVSDWLWVAHQREQGEDFTFYPYSDMTGALMLPKDSPIKSIADLMGKRLGIVGGETDKNWLLLQALAEKYGIALNSSVDKVFGTATQINEQLKNKQIDAAMTYWHFAAQLEAQGYQQLLNDKTILKELNMDDSLPNLGFIFKYHWGVKHQTALSQFFNATQQARKQLCSDDKTWQNALSLMDTKDEKTQQLLRQRFCEGSIEQWGENQQKAGMALFKLLNTQQKKPDLTQELPANTFWLIAP